MNYVRLLVVGISSGILFSFMDVLINQNAMAKTMFEYYKTIARHDLHPYLIILIFVIYGLIMAFIYAILSKSLPGKSGFSKGASFALIAWFFRVVMYSVTQWTILPVPPATLAYLVISGLGQMLVLGWFYGMFLKQEERKSLL